MKKNKGFTLIELLAVIVVLGVIALIATPIVLDIIEEAEEKSNLRTIDFYLDAVDIALADKIYATGSIQNGTYDILSSGNICLAYSGSNCIDTLEVKVKGQKPKQGTITISDSTVTSVSIFINEKEVAYGYNGELVYVKTLDEVCKLKEGTAGEISSKYECKVDPDKAPYTFYILSYLDESGNITTDKSRAVSVNLILESNIKTGGETVKEKNPTFEEKGTVAWASKADLLGANLSLTDFNNGYRNKLGPITAMNYLEEATKGWTNTNAIRTTEFTDEKGNELQMAKEYITNARMPYYDEIKATENNGTVAAWLGKYLHEHGVGELHGYWLLSFSDASRWDAWRVKFDATLTSLGVTLGASESGNVFVGVRPVINLKF